MNEAMFREMRSKAQARGLTVREYVKACGPLPECRGLYRNPDHCISAYDAYKRDAFGRHYGLRPEDDQLKCVIVKGRKPGYRTITVDLETNAMDFTKLEAIAAATVTGRMTSTTPNLQSLPKAASNHIMNKTSIELRAELAAAEATEATAAAKAASAAKLADYKELAQATTVLLQRIGAESAEPAALLAKRRFELKALAAEFNFRIVLIGDRTQAVLVQQ